VLSTIGDVASGPEEQCGVGEEGYEYRDPNPNILTRNLFCFETYADPTPILLPPINFNQPQQWDNNKAPTPTGVS
jgi:hypothetical protein